MSEHRVAVGVADTDLASYQRAVRVLLTNALVTAQHPGADDLERSELPMVQAFMRSKNSG